MTTRDIRYEFLEEAREYTGKIESILIGAGTRQTLPAEQMDSVLRATHSIKGGAAMMGYEPLSGLAHRLEDFFKIIKSSKSIVIDIILEELFLKTVDLLNQLIQWYRTSDAQIDSQWWQDTIAPVINSLEAKLGYDVTDPSAGTPSLDGDEDLAVLVFQSEVENCLQRLESLVAAGNPELLQAEFQQTAQEFGGLGEMLELPAFKELCDNIIDRLDRNQNTLEIAPAILADWRRAQSLVIVGQGAAISTSHQPPTPPTVEAEGVEASPAHDRTLRVSVELLEDIDDRFGELSIYRHGLESQLKRLRHCLGSLRGKLGKLDRTSQELHGYYQEQEQVPLDTAKSDSVKTRLSFFERMYFDRLEMDDYTNIHPAFTEVKEDIFQLYEAANDLETYLDETENVAREIHRASKVIQTKLDRVRMSPLSQITDGLKRALRNLSIKHGKEVSLKVIGASTLIDRTILSGLQDPLLHLIRNSFDHGIEARNRRLKQGKPPEGTITLRTSRRGNQTVIAVSDDGAGINFDKIRRKAIEMGLAADDIQKLNEQELIELIFQPGFTTADRVTDLSGRGVGMDIVRTQVEQLQGTISAYTKADMGTTFTITLPTCLSIIRVFLVEIGGVLSAIPTNTVESMIMPGDDELAQIQADGTFWLEAEKIAVIDLKSWFDNNSNNYHLDEDDQPSIDSPTLLITGKSNQKIGIWIDRYWGEQEVTIRPLEGKLKLPRGFAGCTILGNGRVVPLLEPSQLHHFQTTLIPEVKSTPSLAKNTLLVVDDSVTVRRLLTLTLEKAGYLVESARDGQEALEKLHKGLSVQGVVCDIEMPRLDGYGFLAHVKADPDLQHIPVLMLTSRSGEKHSLIAKHLGAAAYFSKPFQEQDLLQSLEDLLVNILV